MISSHHKKALEVLAFTSSEEDFYNKAVKALSLLTRHKWAVLFIYSRDTNTLKAKAYRKDNKCEAPFNLSLADTPWVSMYLDINEKTNTYCFSHNTEFFVGTPLENACTYQSQLFFDSQGRPLGHIATLHNEKIKQHDEDKHFFHRLSQRISLEYQQFKTHEAILSLKMVESTSHMMAFVDKNYTYRMVSKGYENFFKTAREKIIGSKVGELLGQENFNNTVRKEIDFCLSGNEVNAKYWLAFENSKRIFFDVNLTPCLDGMGNVLGAVVSAHDITETKLYEDRMIEFAHIDSLTDLPNRRYLFERVREQIAKFKRHGGTAVIFFIDLDEFKEVNDSYGHAAGDEVLKEAARRLKASVRQEDIVARIGGDEFIILITDDNDLTHNILESKLLAEKMLSVISQPIDVSNHLVKISGSIGIHLINEKDCSVDDIIRKADVAMYKAKQYGRNRVYVG